VLSEGDFRRVTFSPTQGENSSVEAPSPED
jgi:hypothetical protein